MNIGSIKHISLVALLRASVYTKEEEKYSGPGPFKVHAFILLFIMLIYS